VDHGEPGHALPRDGGARVPGSQVHPRIRHNADDFVTVLALVAAGQGVALVPQLGAIGPPPGVVLTELPARRRTRIAYRNGTRHRPPVSACIALSTPPRTPIGSVGKHSAPTLYGRDRTKLEQ
jgi:DNA-binding transcriptional LysR family regulator